MKTTFYLIVFLSFTISCTPTKETPSAAVVASGRLERIENFQSNHINPRNVDVWLPEDYNESEKYDVIYMHDGQMLFDSSSTWNHQEWGVDETMTKLSKDPTLPKAIVVGIWNTELRYTEYFPQRPYESLKNTNQDSSKNNESLNKLLNSTILSDNYLKFVVTELKPFIDQNYATHPEFDHTYVAGSSMGGLISWYAICEYPEVFGRAACISTHWPGTSDFKMGNPVAVAFQQYLIKHLPPAKSHKIYYDFGTETLDSIYEPFQHVIDSIMISKDYEKSLWITQKFEGQDHSEKSWKSRLDIPFKFLMKK